MEQHFSSAIAVAMSRMPKATMYPDMCMPMIPRWMVWNAPFTGRYARRHQSSVTLTASGVGADYPLASGVQRHTEAAPKVEERKEAPEPGLFLDRREPERIPTRPGLPLILSW